jgi:hypothetical protein
VYGSPHGQALASPMPSMAAIFVHVTDFLGTLIELV